MDSTSDARSDDPVSSELIQSTQQAIELTTTRLKEHQDAADHAIGKAIAHMQAVMAEAELRMNAAVHSAQASIAGQGVAESASSPAVPSSTPSTGSEPNGLGASSSSPLDAVAAALARQAEAHGAGPDVPQV